MAGAGRDGRARRDAHWPHLRRLHGRLRFRLRARGRVGATRRCAAPCRISARAPRRAKADVGALGPPCRELVAIDDATPSVQDRTVTTGTVSADLVRRFAAGGYVGRASARDFDARRDLAYAPYDRLPAEVPSLPGGGGGARPPL